MLDRGITDYGEGLYQACVHGYIDIVRLLIKIYNITVLGTEYLNDACYYGHEDLVKLILEHIDESDLNNGFYHACLGGHISLIPLLTCDKTDWNRGFGAVCTGGDTEVAELLISRVDKTESILNEGLSTAIHNQHIDIVRLIMANMNGIKLNWSYAVCRTCQPQDKDMIKLLIANGVNN